MNAKRNSAALRSGSLLGAALLASGTAMLAAAPANAAVGDVVCDFWTDGAIYNVNVVQSGERAYTVAIADMKTLAGESSNGDYYVRLPMEPSDLRRSVNVVTVPEGLVVSDASISQSVATGPADADPGFEIVEYLGNAAAPWESVSLASNTITWLQDMDAYSDGSGAQSLPSDYFFPGAAYDEATGVLEFTVTIPNAMSGEVALFEQMVASYTSAIRGASTEEWTPLEALSDTVLGCSVTVEAVEDGGGSDPEVPGEPEVPAEPQAPTPPKQVQTAAPARANTSS